MGMIMMPSIGLLFPLALVSLLVYTFARYAIDKKGLRRFPAPSIAAFTPLWISYQTWRGRRYAAVDAAHRVLGPVVRVAPNHISFTDPAAYGDIYGHGAPALKDDFYAIIGGTNPSMAQATDKVVHSQKRKALAHVFSAKEITAMEPRVSKIVQKLICDLEIKSAGGTVAPTDHYKVEDGVFDVRPWMNMFSYDAITAMFFSDCYGFLDRGDDICPSMTASGKIHYVRAMDSFHSGSRFNTMLGYLPESWFKICSKLLARSHGKQAADNFGGMARYKVVERMRCHPEEPDLFSNLPWQATEKRPVPMAVEELIAECATMMDAGNDTTQTSLTNCLYQLALNSEKQTRLRQDLISTLPLEAQPIASYADLQKVPYLRACLDENFRCRSPVATGLPRRTMGNGITIAGHSIPADVTVSVPLWTYHHNEDLFTDANSFVPERWVPSTREGGNNTIEPAKASEMQNLKTYVLPFSLGSRACIGRNLAYMELSITIAALIMSFEWELAVPGSWMPISENFNCNPKELMVRARPLRS